METNAENKSGVKTPEGKAISRYNAVKHGILKEIVSDYEQSIYEEIVEHLDSHFIPVGMLEKILVDRIGVYYLKLYRVAKAENEYMQSTLNPREVVVEDMMDLDMGYTKTVVKNEGYTPKIGQGAVGTLSETYLRYEIAIENRLYKALHELQRLQSARNGEEVPLPMALDIDVSGEKGEGFVSQ